MVNITRTLYTLVSTIKHYDTLEQIHRDDVCSWITSGAPLFCIKKPYVPNKHLVSYFVVYDEKASKLLLVDHIYTPQQLQTMLQKKWFQSS